MPMQNENKNSSDTKNTLSKKIGRATYNVKIYFSKTSKESFNDKILRLIKNDIATAINTDHSKQNRTT
jgi:hypothetical protein